MTQTKRPPLKNPGESWDDYYERLWEFFDLDNDSGEYREGMTELEAEVRMWKLRKEGQLPSPTQVLAALEEALQELQKRDKEREEN